MDKGLEVEVALSFVFDGCGFSLSQSFQREGEREEVYLVYSETESVTETMIKQVVFLHQRLASKTTIAVVPEHTQADMQARIFS